MLIGFDYLSDWTDSMSCLQAASRLKSDSILSAEVARKKGTERCADLLAHAREHSPFYAKYYASIPMGSPLEAYPPVRRSTLMGNFDEWATDRRITEASVTSFLSSTNTIATRYLNDYLVWTSSGTSGEPGIYIQDRHALSIYQSLMSVRYLNKGSAPTNDDTWHASANSNRMAMVAALEGHFAGIVFWKWASRLNPWLAGQTRTFSILQPIAEIVAQLNEWQPKYLSSYPSMLSVLANEQESGRLQLSPSSLWCGGEHLGDQLREQIESAFACKVVEDYGSSEAMNMSFACDHGKLHINTDWFILEPVDENMQAVPAGEKSVTTLVTNLANRVQPIIRYDIGDSITLHTEPCECSNPLPTLHVVGRNDDTLWLPAQDGSKVPILPLSLNTIIEENAEEFGFQIVQNGPQCLTIRTEGDDIKTRKKAFKKISKSLEEYFQSLKVMPMELKFDSQIPVRDAASGKLNQVFGHTQKTR